MKAAVKPTIPGRTILRATSHNGARQTANQGLQPGVQPGFRQQINMQAKSNSHPGLMVHRENISIIYSLMIFSHFSAFVILIVNLTFEFYAIKCTQCFSLPTVEIPCLPWWDSSKKSPRIVRFYWIFFFACNLYNSGRFNLRHSFSYTVSKWPDTMYFSVLGHQLTVYWIYHIEDLQLYICVGLYHTT